MFLTIFTVFFLDCSTGRKGHFNLWTTISDCKCSELLVFFWHCILVWCRMFWVEKRTRQMWKQQLARLFHVSCTKNYVKGLVRLSVVYEWSKVGVKCLLYVLLHQWECDCPPLKKIKNQAKQSQNKAFLFGRWKTAQSTCILSERFLFADSLHIDIVSTLKDFSSGLEGREWKSPSMDHCGSCGGFLFL